MVVNAFAPQDVAGALLVVTVIAAAVVSGAASCSSAGRMPARTSWWPSCRRSWPAGEGRAAGGLLGAGLRARHRRVEIGLASAREPGPALRIERARLRVGLWQAIFSLGRRVHIKEAALAGVTANVVRFPDGTTNWQRIRERLDSKSRASR